MALNRPFGVDDDLSFENWLAISIGEFVWYCFPDLIGNLEPVRMMYPKLRPFASNVTIPPPGYPEQFGRELVDGEIEWGNHYFKNGP